MANSDKIRAGRNRTLTVSEEEIPDLKRIITFPEELSGKSSFVDLLINADALTVLDKIPDECASLIILAVQDHVVECVVLDHAVQRGCRISDNGEVQCHV